MSLTRKAALTVFLLALSAGAALADVEVVGELGWPDEWTVFVAEEPDSPPLPPEALLAIPEEVQVDDERLQSRRVVPTHEQFDFAPLFGEVAKARTAYVFLPIESEAEQEATLGLGADWWMQAWLNGELILDTTGKGNIAWPPSIRDHPVTAKFRQGTNMLAVRFLSGTGSSVLALGGPAHLRRGAGPSLVRRRTRRVMEELKSRDFPEDRRTPGAFVREFVVAPDGSDDNPGTAEQPFATIQKAANVARGGDLVFVRAGEYQENVVFPRSGQPGAPIVFTGERGPDGEWLTIVDPGIPATGWVPAPEVGPGVFKTDDLPFNPWCMTRDGKHLGRLADRLMALDKDAPPPDEPLMRIPQTTTRQREGIGGFSMLRLPADAVSDTMYVGEMPYWNGIEAMYGHLGGTTYIRFRHGDDPGEMRLKAAPQGPAMLIEGQSHIVIRNFLVRGAERSVILAGRDAANNVIENNCMMHGRSRVLLTDGAGRNLVQNNYMTLNFYGHDSPGAWGMRDHTDLAKMRCHIYQEFKYTIGPGGSDDRGIQAVEAGPDNVARGNRIHAGLIGISVRLTPWFRAYRNVVSNMSSIGILTSGGAYNAMVHDNVIFDCNLNFRIHHYNTPDVPRREYHFRNVSYQPVEGLGSHIYVHYHDRPWPNEPEDPEIFLYHNTYSGGRSGLSVSGYARRLGGMRRTVAVNNVFSVPGASFANPRSWYWRIEDMFEAVDFNWAVGPGPIEDEARPPWLGPNNVLSEEPYLWPAGVADFVLPEGSACRGAGIDLSRPFTLLSKEYDALPGMFPGYFEGEAPDLGAFQQGQTLDPALARELP